MNERESIKTISEHVSFGGVQGYYEHVSSSIGLPMRFGVYRPPQAQQGPVPVLYWLSGLTCTEETFAIKAGAQQHAACHGLMLVMPDTSPRHTGIAQADEHWDFGHGAGFYLDATTEPWRRHWRMESYVTQELPALIAAHFPARTEGSSIFGHSMGGHGALTLALRHRGMYRSVSAFAPVAAPSRCPWGIKAFGNFLGFARAAWAEHDATELIKSGARTPPLLIDQGLADKFLAEQLNIDTFEAACREAGQPLELRRREGYDHGYFFISTFIGEHIEHHARALGAAP